MVLIVSHRDVSPSVGGVFPLFPMPQGLEDSSGNVSPCLKYSLHVGHVTITVRRRSNINISH